MGAGVSLGLQNRCGPAKGSGGFDSYTLPPIALFGPKSFCRNRCSENNGLSPGNRSMNADGFQNSLKLVALLGTGLVAGVFFAFSCSVMAALAQLPAAQGIAAMQKMNVVIVRSPFLGIFLATAVACLVLSIASFLPTVRPKAGFVLAGCLLYLVGAFGITVAGNVPLNDALANVSANTSEAVKLWEHYLDRWVMLNHLRTVTTLASTACLALSL